MKAQAHIARWRLVGPWYRWDEPGLPAAGLKSRPALQMFAGDDFVTRFLARPQHSLKSDPLIDVVQRYDLVSAGNYAAGKVAALFALRANGDPVPRYVKQGGVDVLNPEPAFRARPAPGSLRKLYQPTHDRHYIVSCGLHCDEPGFPRVKREQVCQAGFVLRRRVTQAPANITAAQIDAAQAAMRRAEADLYEALQLDAAATPGPNDLPADADLQRRARTRQAALATRESPATDWAGLMTHRRDAVKRERKAYDDWLLAHQIKVQVQGWFPLLDSGRPSPTQGGWKTLRPDEQTADPVPRSDAVPGEHVTPLFALVPDPRDTAHDATGRTLYYGLVPTNSLQADARGLPRFEDQATYELRCFVRAHHACPPRAGREPDCDGGVVWSDSSEPFRIASPLDVLGSANRPINIKMPDLRDLAAAAATRPRGKLSPVRFIQPQHMSPQGDGGTMGGAAICSFSIPLITIIALFVLNLFLPIVVFIFNLWFLLVLRFCIPPQIEASADVDAALAVTPPGVDLDADFAVEVSGVAQTAAQLSALMKLAMKVRVVEDTGKTDKAPDFGGLGNNALGPVDQSFSDAAALKAASAGGPLPPPPAVGSPLVYEPHVTSVWTPEKAPA